MEQSNGVRQPTNVEKLKMLPWSIASEASNSVFAQFTFWGAPFVLFFSELNLSNTEIGFIFSLLPFFGLIAIFVNPFVTRFGYKRSYLTFFLARKFFTLFLLLVPWINTHYGGRYTLLYVTIIFVLFSITRSTAITAYFPWRQEYVPDNVRGKYAATNNIVAQLTGMVAVLFAGYIVGRSQDINRFLILIALGVAFGLLSALLMSRVPGGAPKKVTNTQQSGLGETLRTLRDGNFRLYLLGLGLITFANAPESTFVPLFMQREAGLNESQIVLLQTGVLIGGLASTYFWGWASDRYGSKPVIQSGLYLRLVLIVGWIMIPRGTAATLPIAVALACIQGITTISWVIGAGRLLYVRIVPPEKKSEYMAVYYAVLGLFGGLSQLLGGGLVDLMSGLSGTYGGITLNPFAPLFLISLVLTALGIFLLQKVSADHDFSVGQFIGMFVRGRPLGALSSVARYHYAQDERASIIATENLGKAKSPLAVEELLDALADPRFNVRFEAIIAMARMRKDPRVIKALQAIALGSELSLTAPAIWALGRIGSPDAIETLQVGLDADYRSIRAHSARALGTLNDQVSAPVLLSRLRSEKNPGLDLAYASALGNLNYAPAVPAILDVLDSAETQGERYELALALARIIGDEKQFIQLLRKERADMGTASAQALALLRKRFSAEPTLQATFNACLEAFANQSLSEGATYLGQLIEQLPAGAIAAPADKVLDFCRENLRADGVTHPECVILSVAILSKVDINSI